jgi:hypothetical protein
VPRVFSSAGPSLGGIPARAGRFDMRLPQRLQRFVEPGVPPVQHMVVRQGARINTCGRQTRKVLRAHPVVDTFVSPVIVTPRYRRLEVDDPHVGRPALQFCEGVAPDVGKVDGLGNRAVHPLRKLHVISRVSYVWLVEPWITRECDKTWSIPGPGITSPHGNKIKGSDITESSRPVRRMAL